MTEPLSQPEPLPDKPLEVQVTTFSICTSTPEPLSVHEPAFMTAPTRKPGARLELYVTVICGLEGEYDYLKVTLLEY